MPPDILLTLTVSILLYLSEKGTCQKLQLPLRADIRTGRAWLPFSWLRRIFTALREFRRGFNILSPFLRAGYRHAPGLSRLSRVSHHLIFHPAPEHIKIAP